jgi:hypothetical protein
VLAEERVARHDHLPADAPVGLEQNRGPERRDPGGTGERDPDPAPLGRLGQAVLVKHQRGPGPLVVGGCQHVVGLAGDHQIDPAIEIEIGGDHLPGVVIKAGIQHETQVLEALPCLIDQQGVHLEAVPGDLGSVGNRRQIRLHVLPSQAGQEVDVVAPETAAIVLRRLARDVAVADVDILVAVVVEVEGNRAPGPAGAGHRILVGRLRKAPIGLGKIHPVAVAHHRPHPIGLVVAGGEGRHSFQSAGGGRTHPCHEHVEPSVAVIVGEGVRHPEGAGRFESGIGDILKPAAAVVEIEVGAAEVRHDDEVEIAVTVEVHKRRRRPVRTAPGASRNG